MDPQPKNIVLFDGVCNLCNASVNWIIRHDCHKVFHFASIQSKTARALLKPWQAEKISDSVLYIENGVLYQESTAALRIARHLCGWKPLSWLIIVPRWLRDPVYRLIARKRYKWFGKRDACMVPDENLKKRFL